jgi:hypothetical protein
MSPDPMQTSHSRGRGGCKEWLGNNRALFGTDSSSVLQWYRCETLRTGEALEVAESRKLKLRKMTTAVGL